MEFPEIPRSRSRSGSISFRVHGGWISDSEYLGELSLLCNEVSCLFCCYLWIVFVSFIVLKHKILLIVKGFDLVATHK